MEFDILLPKFPFFMSLDQDQVKLFRRVRLFVTPWTVAYHAPPSTGFSRQEYWSGLPFPSPEDLPDPGIEPRSPALQADALPSEPLTIIETYNNKYKKYCQCKEKNIKGNYILQLGDSTGQCGMLQSMESQRARHDLAIEQIFYRLKKERRSSYKGGSEKQSVLRQKRISMDRSSIMSKAEGNCNRVRTSNLL